jgi:AcrR family transcriptional regulator
VNAVQFKMNREARQQHARDVNRRAILDAALALFLENGYDRVSMRNIAARVEYSPAAIYGYFPSKDEIFYALAEEGFRLLGAKHPSAPASDDPIEHVRSAAWRFYEFSKEQPQYFALVFLDRQVPRIGRDFERFPVLLEQRNRLIAQMQRCVSEGALPASLDAHVAVKLLWAPIFGIAALRLSDRIPTTEHADALVRDAIETTIAGLRAGVARHAKGEASMPEEVEAAAVSPVPATSA